MEPEPINGARFQTETLRGELVHRRHLLETAARDESSGEVQRLLHQVDEALHRMDTGSFGACRICHDAIEPEGLRSDPLRSVCLECLSASERKNLEADLELAAEFQGSLIPKGELNARGWQAFVHSDPAGAVGGDFVDLIEAPDQDLVHFVVGDVSGKGVAAALFGSHLLALIKSSMAVPQTLSARVAAVNRIFAEVTPTRVFATLVWGVVDSNGLGELVNAGHLPVMAVGRGGCRKLESSGVPVGLFPGARFQSTPFQLEAGEQLLLVTDGITESTDEGDNEYGVDGLWSLVSTKDLDLSPEDAVSKYLGDVARHRNGVGPQDDVTVMVLRRDCCDRMNGLGA